MNLLSILNKRNKLYSHEIPNRKRNQFEYRSFIDRIVESDINEEDDKEELIKET